MKFKCADCGCDPDDCLKVKQGLNDSCPNCTYERCCCVYDDG